MRTSLIVFIAIALVAAITPHEARGAEMLQNWMSVRAAGMGNAYTAVVQDGDSLFYNPAGLARVKGFNWSVFDIHAGLNGAETITTATNVINSGTSNISQTLNDLYNKKVWASGGAKSVIYVPYFAAAAYANTEAGFSAHSPPNANLRANYFFDYGGVVGGAIDMLPGIWSFGLAARRVNRTGTTLPLGASALATLDQAQLERELKRRGSGYGLDLGTVIRIPGPIKPSLSFVYRDAGYTSFSHDEGAGAPPRIEPEMLVGAGFEIDVPLLTVTSALDYRYLNNSTMQMGQRINFGVEVAIPILRFRGGLHQGYWTAGAGLDLGVLKVDAATYGVERGEFPGQHEDRRYMAQVTFELGFDPAMFSFSGSSGKGGGERRSLKQRR